MNIGTVYIIIATGINLGAYFSLHGPIAHHLVPLDGVDLDVRVVHEAVNADAGAEETGKGEAHLEGVGRGIRQPMFLRVGASHGGSLVAINKNIWEERLRRLHASERRP